MDGRHGSHGGLSDRSSRELPAQNSSPHLGQPGGTAPSLPGPIMPYQPGIPIHPPNTMYPMPFLFPNFGPPDSSGYAVSGYGSNMPIEGGLPGFVDTAHTSHGRRIAREHGLHNDERQGYRFGGPPGLLLDRPWQVPHGNIHEPSNAGHNSYQAENNHTTNAHPIPVNRPHGNLFADSSMWGMANLLPQDNARGVSQGFAHYDLRRHPGHVPPPGALHLGLSEHYETENALYPEVVQVCQEPQRVKPEEQPGIQQPPRKPREQPKYAFDVSRSKEEIERLVREHEPRGRETMSEQICNALHIGCDFETYRKIHGVSLEELIQTTDTTKSSKPVDHGPILGKRVEEMAEVNAAPGVSDSEPTRGGDLDHSSIKTEHGIAEKVDKDFMTENSPKPASEGKSKPAHKRPNQTERRRMHHLNLSLLSSVEDSSQHTQQPTRRLQNDQQPSNGNWRNVPASITSHQNDGSSHPESQPILTMSTQTPPLGRSDSSGNWRGGSAPQAQYIFSRQSGPNRQQLQRGRGRFANHAEELRVQSDFLTGVAQVEVTNVEADPLELEQKELFRAELEVICKQVVLKDAQRHPNDLDPPLDLSSVRLECFGSLKSGFATRSSDMDLVLITPKSHPLISVPESRIPRILEKRLLEEGYGARLLTKTRVPIIKLCQKPTPELMSLLIEARQKWEDKIVEDALSEKDTEATSFSKDEQQHAESLDNAEALITEPDFSHFQTMKINDAEDTTSAQILTQNDNETLWEYNCRARNLLKKLGGRDITLGGDDFNSDERLLLTTATEGFFNGIRDENLQRAIRSALPDGFLPSLYGAWLLAEGEYLITGWDARMVHEGTGEDESLGYKLIQEWRRVPLRGDMKLGEYNETLRKIWDRLKQLPSLKLQILAQRSDEPIAAYGTRTRAVLRELGVRDLGAGKTAMEVHPVHRLILRTAVVRYVEGICDRELREYVRKEVPDDTINFADVTSIHMAEYYIKKHKLGQSLGIYTVSERIMSERYETLVRNFGIHYPEVVSMMDKLKSLPDPYQRNKKRAFATDPLEFPKTGVGIQCDINFSNTLAVHNTLLLRCYHLSDPRVRPMVIFIKSWAKKRMINNAYLGTLCSYGYVLMVLHYLLNITSPAVLTNLQTVGAKTKLDQGCNVAFWSDEEKIQHLASAGQLTDNKESLGSLLRGFFEYYSHNGPHVIRCGFSWATEVISIRTKGGLISKETKGWTGAKTIVMGDKEIRQRYLIAIEDPFETGHNVGRTVNHQGIIAIRDEFRRAWRIISAVGKGNKVEEGLLG